MSDRTLFFANIRLDIICDEADLAFPRHIDDFSGPQPYDSVISLQIRDIRDLPDCYRIPDGAVSVCTTDRFDIFDHSGKWIFVENTNEKGKNSILVCGRGYKEMTLFLANSYFPLSSLIRVACESGMVTSSGLPLHASLVEKDGAGILFLGPSGMGKSTQAKLWVKYQDADFVSGDRPGLYRKDGRWYGCGMPWDGKDGLYRQKTVPVRAVVALEQADKNEIRRMDGREAMKVLLKQVMMPMWDKDAMEYNSADMWQLAGEAEFYHLKNRADEGSVTVLKEMLGGLLVIDEISEKEMK